MRCSKCGYISFDHLDSCRRCHKPMGTTEFAGAALAFEAPHFLQPTQTVSTGGPDADLIDILDPDLDVLADSEGHGALGFEVDDEGVAPSQAKVYEGEIDPGKDFKIDLEGSSTRSGMSLDEDDLMIDTSRFADVPVNMDSVQTTQAAPLVIPEALEDISDLARPDSFVETAPTPAETRGGRGADLDLEELSLDDLDLSLGDRAGGGSTGAGRSGLTDLSLDDIDLSGGVGAAPSSPSPATDDDLNFDLDLGMFDEPGSKPKKKGSDDLADLTLTLD